MAHGTADEMADNIVKALNGKSDLVLNEPLTAIGSACIILVGPHADDGFCWCQPKMLFCRDCGHKHPVHRDVSH